jgi:hypothetical protein
MDVASATFENVSAAADATSSAISTLVPALKGRAKFKLPLRGED